MGLAYFARNNPRKAISYLNQAMSMAKHFHHVENPVMSKIKKNLQSVIVRAKTSVKPGKSPN